MHSCIVSIFLKQTNRFNAAMNFICGSLKLMHPWDKAPLGVGWEEGSVKMKCCVVLVLIFKLCMVVTYGTLPIAKGEKPVLLTEAM